MSICTNIFLDFAYMYLYLINFPSSWAQTLCSVDPSLPSCWHTDRQTLGLQPAGCWYRQTQLAGGALVTLTSAAAPKVSQTPGCHLRHDLSLMLSVTSFNNTIFSSVLDAATCIL